MVDPFIAGREFVRGAARFGDLCYLLTKSKALMAQEIAHTSAIGVDEGAWGDAVKVPWDSTAIAVANLPVQELVFVGEDGEVCTYSGGVEASESIRPAPKLIRNARSIEGEVYACGMKRQVYRRAAKGRWIDVSPGDKQAGGKGGFEAVDGYSHAELYAVGWNGEVWYFDGKRWTDCSSPTNLILSAVCCAGDGVVYAAGQQGVMLRGRAAAWESIAWEGEVSADLWDLCWFANELYVATIDALFTLDGATLKPVKFPKRVGQPTCFNLTQAEGVLWSIGQADVLSFNGKTWTRYD